MSQKTFESDLSHIHLPDWWNAVFYWQMNIQSLAIKYLIHWTIGTLEQVWTVLKHKQPSAPLHPWSWPKQPWSRTHLDFAGPLFNHMYLVVVDAHTYTKWILCQTRHHLAPFNNLEHSSLSLVFIGLAVVLDNVPSFTSAEFQDFMYKNDKHHIHSSPYHALSNGLTGCAVHVFKGLKQKMKLQFLTR